MVEGIFETQIIAEEHNTDMSVNIVDTSNGKCYWCAFLCGKF